MWAAVARDWLDNKKIVKAKKQTKTKNGDGDYEDAIKERNFGWKATSCQTVVKGQSLIIFND